jgi:hypothetical protein
MATAVEIEAAARAAHRAAAGLAGAVGSWDNLPEEARKHWRDVAGAALDAAERVREILLNDRTARTVPGQGAL